MIGKTDLASTVHFGRLAVQLGQCNFGRGCWIRNWDLRVVEMKIVNGVFSATPLYAATTYIKLYVELVLVQIVHVPALAEPFRALLV